MLLIYDNFDSFTYNLVDYFGRLGAACEVLRNDANAAEVFARNPRGLVLSPGPETPAKAGHLMGVLAAAAGRLPILGICLGHQAIGEHFGAKLTKAARPMHGKISTVAHSGAPLFAEVPPTFDVVRYHSLLLQDLPDCLQATAHTAQGEIMAIQHRTLPIWGIQYHPEAYLTQFGLQVLGNWLKITS